MIDIKIYRGSEHSADISQLKIQRDWMNNSNFQDIYLCPPITSSNNIGWGISFPEDISFMWNGIEDDTQNNVKILSGEKYAYCMRERIIRFKTNLTFRTTKDYTLCQGSVPNFFYEDFMPLSVTLSTSFFKGDLQPAIRVNTSNKIITIPANTQIFSVLPINLKMLDKTNIKIYNANNAQLDSIVNSEKYEKLSKINNENRKFLNFYKNGVDENGNQIGEHQVKKLNLYVEETGL
jgi:hypothetical protein